METKQKETCTWRIAADNDLYKEMQHIGEVTFLKGHPCRSCPGYDPDCGAYEAMGAPVVTADMTQIEKFNKRYAV